AHFLGLLLASFALSYALPIGCSLLLADHLWPKFLLAAAITAACGLALAMATLPSRRELKPRDGFLLVTLGWLLLPAAAALPLLGVGGMQLHKGLAPGREERLAPRITETAKSLWLVYAVITVAGIAALRICGMSWFDAVCHAFSAVGLGGFSPHDRSIAWFDSPAIELLLIALMLIASLNFARHFIALQRLSLESYRTDPECKAIFLILSVSVVGIAALLTQDGVYGEFMTSLRHSAFNVVSQATTSGLTTQDYQRWPVFAPYWMLFLSCIVCSTGSTGGGIKMFRTLLLARQAGRELTLLIHPAAMAPVRIGGRPIPDGVG